MSINILNWRDYQQDGGKLTYHQWIQCLVDSGNITKGMAKLAISTYDEGEAILSIPDQLKGDAFRGVTR